MEKDTKRAFEALAPFMLRTRTLVTGRRKLVQMQNRLQFVLFTRDLSPNSRDELAERLRCPVVEAYTSEAIEKLFGLKHTKVVGFRCGDLGTQALKHLLAAGAVKHSPTTKTKTDRPDQNRRNRPTTGLDTKEEA